jgi:hypothetical protein
MIEPPSVDPPRVGPLATPREDELVAAYAMLRNETLTLPWAAEALGIGVARVEALVRAGELLAIPGPWPMRQAHGSGLGYFLPGWQLGPDGRHPHPDLPAVLEAAAAAGWTGLDLHRFMTRPVGADESSPARLLRAGEVERVIALIRGEPDPLPPPPAPAPLFRPLRAVHRPHPRRHAVT